MWNDTVRPSRARFLAILGILLLATTGSLSATPIRLAVASIEAVGVADDVTHTVQELLQAAFARRPEFQLVERAQLAAILEEQQVQLSGLTAAETSVEVGAVLNVDKVLVASVSRYQSEFVTYLLSVRLVDVEQAAIEAAESIQVRSDEDLADAVAQLVNKLGQSIQISGNVAWVDGQAVYTTLGGAFGVRQGTMLSAFRVTLIRDDDGRVIMREETPIANLRAESVSAEGCRCTVVAGEEAPQEGDLVRIGEARLTVDQQHALLDVSSIPEGARVFLGREFVGTTPLELDRIEPGSYQVEIRAGGYHPYAGTVRLASGRSIVLERELEPEISVEDLLLLGKMPRRTTSASQAVRKALVPGGGYIYNGYETTGRLVPAQMLLSLTGGALMAVQAVGNQRSVDSAGTPSASDTYWERREYHRNTSGVATHWMQAALLGGAALSSYAWSVADSVLSADDDFLYPTYAQLSVGAYASLTAMEQTEDTQTLVTGAQTFNGWVTSGINSVYPGGSVRLAFQGREIYTALDLSLTNKPISLQLTSAVRAPLSESVYLGPGVSAFLNLGGPDDVGFSDGAEALDPLVGGRFAAVISLSVLGTQFELDALLSPFAVGSAQGFAPESDSYLVSDSVAGLRGFGGELSTAVFWNLSTGVRLFGSYYRLAPKDGHALEAQGFTVPAITQFAEAGVALVFRL